VRVARPAAVVTTADRRVRALAAEADAALRAGAVPGRAEQERRYLKSTLEHLGTPLPSTRAVARELLRAHPDLDHDDLVSLVHALWASTVYEHRALVTELLVGADLLETGDVDLVEHLLRTGRTWALVDVLAATVVGRLVERDADLGPVLDRWAVDDDFWLRRAALLALLGPLRRGEGDWARFTRYADAMLDEREFFVRKAIGWVLRETGRRRPALVHAWLLPRATRASGVTVREAVKPLSESQRAEILAVR
jgi:3-methyladenine DNA glycosylase AlkD